MCMHSLESLLSGQLVMGARFDNLALLYEVDLVALLDSAEAVSDRDRRTALGRTIQCILNNSFTVAIESGRGFIKEQDSRVTKQSTGDGNTLFLTAAELTTLATDLSIEATVMMIRVEQGSVDGNTYSGNEVIKSRMFASRQAASSSSCVTSSGALMAPRRMLNRIVPA